MLQTVLNAHSLFSGEAANTPFLDRLDLPDARIVTLRSARDKIRTRLTECFRQWQDFCAPEVVIERMLLRSGAPLPKLRPKFRRQGSYAYRTLNAPAHYGQQVDFDDGVFLPVSFFTNKAGEDAQTPFLTSEGYFALVEAMLVALCKAQGWKLRRKNSCVRVELNSQSHIDLALYAIPDKEYETLVEKLVFNDSAMDSVQTYDRMNKRVYRQLVPGSIMLAEREVGWLESDPRKIEDWFLDAIATHGEQLRRVCRFFKAWRDFQWENGCKLSSITIMKCVVDAFDALKGRFDTSRDDAAILMVAERLPACFADENGISNPVLDLKLNGNWEPAERSEYVAEAQKLHRQISQAIQSTRDPELALQKITAIFGARIPDDADLIRPVAAERLIQSFQIKKTEAPKVGRSISG